ncbi:hypothetical protein M902_2577 [Bacteriovorax sp. BAL6_X]|uniref:hypothetical protein n=1 Tax=Bacteriovorax sp. BAL6_X TaxID=1201290 RepID=UPI0003856DF7|nr:hypothetical protein [Bacteriovorax sp. BAL6_X]EPZ51307.1 hypothetical protein M902_2577 [Bacteriovorax sp. BAL6_X]
MRKLLIIHSDERIQSSVREYLTNEYSFEIECLENSSFLKSADDLASFDGVICENKYIDNEGRSIPGGQNFVNFMIDHTIKKPIVILGEMEIDYGNFVSLPSRFSLRDISLQLIKSLNITDEELRHLKMPDFVSVEIANFYQLSNPCCDIYIKMKKSGVEHFVKRIYANDVLDKDIVRRYEQNNLTHFFVQKEDFERLMGQILSQSLTKVVKAFKQDKKVMEVSSDTFEISQNLLNEIGITPQTVKLAKTSIVAMTKTVSSSKKLSTLLRSLLENETTYAFKRNYLSSLFFYQIIPNLGWGRGEQLKQTMDKVCYICFFHDILLREEKLLKIHSLDDLEQVELSDSEKKLVLDHANLTTTLLQEISGIPTGIDVIVRQHHGSLNGVGFPDVYTSNLSPLAISFIVIEKYVVEILKCIEGREKLKLNTILSELEEFFHLSSYRKIIFELKSLIS